MFSTIGKFYNAVIEFNCETLDFISYPIIYIMVFLNLLY